MGRAAVSAADANGALGASRRDVDGANSLTLCSFLAFHVVKWQNPFSFSVCGLILVVFVLSEVISAGLKTLFTPEYFTFLRCLSVTMMLTLQRANTVNL